MDSNPEFEKNPEQSRVTFFQDNFWKFCSQRFVHNFIRNICAKFHQCSIKDAGGVVFLASVVVENCVLSKWLSKLIHGESVFLLNFVNLLTYFSEILHIWSTSDINMKSLTKVYNSYTVAMETAFLSHFS